MAMPVLVLGSPAPAAGACATCTHMRGGGEEGAQATVQLGAHHNLRAHVPRDAAGCTRARQGVRLGVPIVLMPCRKVVGSSPAAGMGPHRIWPHGGTAMQTRKAGGGISEGKQTGGSTSPQPHTHTPPLTCEGSALSVDKSPMNSGDTVVGFRSE